VDLAVQANLTHPKATALEQWAGLKQAIGLYFYSGILIQEFLLEG
jgi:hypothetical protein